MNTELVKVTNTHEISVNIKWLFKGANCKTLRSQLKEELRELAQ